MFAGGKEAHRLREHGVGVTSIVGNADDAENSQLMAILRFDLSGRHLKLALHLREQRLDDLTFVLQRLTKRNMQRNPRRADHHALR